MTGSSQKEHDSLFWHISAIKNIFVQHYPKSLSTADVKAFLLLNKLFTAENGFLLSFLNILDLPFVPFVPVISSVNQFVPCVPKLL